MTRQLSYHVVLLLAAVVSVPVMAQFQADPADLEIRKSVDVQNPSDPQQPVEFLIEVEHVRGGPADRLTMWL